MARRARRGAGRRPDDLAVGPRRALFRERALRLLRRPRRWRAALPGPDYLGFALSERVYFFEGRDTTTIPVPGTTSLATAEAMIGRWTREAQVEARVGLDPRTRTRSRTRSSTRPSRLSLDVAPFGELRAGWARDQTMLTRTRMGGLNPYVVPRRAPRGPSCGWSASSRRGSGWRRARATSTWRRWSTPLCTTRARWPRGSRCASAASCGAGSSRGRWLGAVARAAAGLPGALGVPARGHGWAACGIADPIEQVAQARAARSFAEPPLSSTSMTVLSTRNTAPRSPAGTARPIRSESARKSERCRSVPEWAR